MATLKEQLADLQRRMTEERDARERARTSGGPRLPDRCEAGMPRGPYRVRNMRLQGKAHYS